LSILFTIIIYNRWTTGKIVMFTSKHLEPRNIAPDLVKVIESHEIQSVPLPEAVRKHFRGREDSSPVWVIIDGKGVYIHGTLMPCTKHSNGQKKGKRCVNIQDWKVTVTKCKHPRIEQQMRIINQ
jgi:hypothetical protein